MRVSQDTRTIKKGDWFVAVKGERYDGHDFVSDALGKGAVGVLEVEELYELAKERVRVVGPEVVAVTGSYGKTTTKEAVAKALGSKFKVLRTSGNFNTPIGIAMEIVNNLELGCQIFVVEVGMDRLGEIKESCEIVGPRVGIITSIGEMHLEKLGTLAKIKKAKVELLEALPADGMAVLNCDDAGVQEIAGAFGSEKIWYGFSHRAEVGPLYLEGLDWKLLGRGNQYAALAACTVGRIFGIPNEEVLRALQGLRSLKGRLNLLTGRNGVRIIDDTYNAGPRSMAVALDALAELSAGRRIAVLGDMLELGELEEEAHFNVVTRAFQVADIVVLKGARMNNAFRSCARSILDGGKAELGSIEQLRLKKGDVILVKGSRGMRMERIVEYFLKDGTRGSDLLNCFY